jgi:hypothetical protein
MSNPKSGKPKPKPPVPDFEYRRPRICANIDEVMRQLDRSGFAVVRALSTEESAQTVQMFGADMHSFTKGKFDITKPETYETLREFRPSHSQLWSNFRVGTWPSVCHVRQHEGVTRWFKGLYGLGDGDLLGASLDGFSFYAGTNVSGELKEFARNGWPHVDSTRHKGFGGQEEQRDPIYQALVNLMPVAEHGATFGVWKGSHKVYEEVMDKVMNNGSCKNRNIYFLSGDEMSFLAGHRPIALLLEAGKIFGLQNLFIGADKWCNT